MWVLIAFLGGLISVSGVILFFVIRFLDMKNGKPGPLVGDDYDCNDPKYYPKWLPHVNDPANPFNHS